MANRILTDEGWEGRVRDKLGVTEKELPNAALNQPDVITVAEAKICRALPNYTELTGDDRTFLEAATVCMVALQVIDSMPTRLPARMQGPGMEVEVDIDWQERRRQLETERNDYLEMIQNVTPPPGFRCIGPKG